MSNIETLVVSRSVGVKHLLRLGSVTKNKRYANSSSSAVGTAFDKEGKVVGTFTKHRLAEVCKSMKMVKNTEVCRIYARAT